jgi:hypothetical protein
MADLLDTGIADLDPDVHAAIPAVAPSADDVGDDRVRELRVVRGHAGAGLGARRRGFGADGTAPDW